MTESGNSMVRCRVSPFRGYWIFATIGALTLACVGCVSCLLAVGILASMGGA